jgi:hypothetical protein
VHHRVCAGVLESAPGRDCHGVAAVFEDRIEIAGSHDFGGGVWALAERPAAAAAAAAP